MFLNPLGGVGGGEMNVLSHNPFGKGGGVQGWNTEFNKDFVD
jgi:hypothetical protein